MLYTLIVIIVIIAITILFYIIISPFIENADIIFFSMILSGYFPLFFLILTRIYKDREFLTFYSLLPGLILFSFLIFSVFSLKQTILSFLLSEYDVFYFNYLFVKISLDVAILSLTVSLFSIYYQQKKFNIFTMGMISVIFLYLSDLFSILEYFNIVKTSKFSSIFFIYIFITIIIFSFIYPKPQVKTLTEIEREKEELSVLYKETEELVHFLVILNKFFRHDLNNDLVVLSSSLELYRETGDKQFLDLLDSRIKEVESRINKQISTKDILSNIEIQKIPISFITNISYLFNNVSVKLPKKKIFVRGNKLLNLIIYNIISNAFIHGEKTTKVEIECFVENSFAHIKIKDNGKGMTDEEKESVLQSELPRTNSGGVGLSLARRTIESLGGKLYFSDNKPSGLLVSLLIPLWEEKKEK
ncbi:MAG: HAMP domain-containing histidine kinase [Candidatus Heimdallarchaeum endolithica]|uniref:histidine kinase n=1 Tax=Candidatus Heimdallarchaeum endolithica TaxID=2876572 RepID=A0A9Y1FP75_9ARCH|nr:MAG: HAMP domain-containing histidine kinase [Candidatus Heimdallarchaeum endolithica]